MYVRHVVRSTQGMYVVRRTEDKNYFFIYIFSFSLTGKLLVQYDIYHIIPYWTERYSTMIYRRVNIMELVLVSSENMVGLQE